MRSSVASRALIIVATLALFGPLGTPSVQAQDGARVAVLISFRSFPGPAQESVVRGAGGRIKYTYSLVPAIAASMPESAIEGLLRNPNITSVEEDGVIQAIDAELDNTWGVQRIGAGSIHAAGNRGAGVKVAVLDSGIDYTHPELVLSATDATGAPLGYDFVNSDNDPMDDAGHGTHVSGTIVASDDGLGVVGVAPDADLYALKILNSSGSGNWSDVIAALEWAVNNGIQITNNSYTSSKNPGGTVQAAFDTSAAAGILHVGAAGNTGNPKGKGNNIGYPARFDSVVAVTATNQSDVRASFSSTGDQAELAAPGVAVNSTKLGGGYVEFNGTSMASPHVAGTAALVIAGGIGDANGDGWVNDDVRQRLAETADDLGDPGRDPLYGFGLVDAGEAADLGPPNDLPSVSISSPADGTTFDSGTLVSFVGTAGDTEDGDLTASLAWTSDIDGALGSGGAVSASLSDGVHSITASVTDSGGKTGDASITVTVGTPPPPPPTADSVSVESVTYRTEGGRNSDKHLLITVTLVDDTGGPVANASLSIDLFRDGALFATGAGTTGAGGFVTFTLKNARSGAYTTDVTSVSAAGLTWDGVTPSNGFVK